VAERRWPWHASARSSWPRLLDHHESTTTWWLAPFFRGRYPNARLDEEAVHLLRTTNKSVEAIASLVGYADGVTLRRLIRRKLGKGVKEIRRFQ